MCTFLDNPPYCLRYRYHEVLSEGTRPGTHVLTVLATDIDEEPNANLRYYLTGDGADHFALDKAKGNNGVSKMFTQYRIPIYSLI